ncbi:MAG: hypothetical protein LBV45_07160, partial [Xanthomonadaceae bacterium]|nr:hypothetical protein [Xanthomonadaceae bacterium]
MKIVRNVIVAFLFVYITSCQSSISDAHAWPKPKIIDQTELDIYISAAKQAETIENIVERCLSYPNMPGQQWYEGYQNYRCNLLSVKYPEFKEIKTLFDNHGVSGLEQVFNEALEAQYQDIDRVEPLFILMDVFDASQSAYELASNWYEQAPDSIFAQAALGSTLYAQAS